MGGSVSHTASPARVSATGRIAAPAHEVWLIVSDPTRHVEIDGSGILQAASDARLLTAAGQTFDMDMDRRPLGDIPNMAGYQVRCTVTRLVPDRLIEWAVRAAGKPASGHVYGWQIEPVGDTACLVTNYCDWTNISDQLRRSLPDQWCPSTGWRSPSPTSSAGQPRKPGRLAGVAVCLLDGRCTPPICCESVSGGVGIRVRHAVPATVRGRWRCHPWRRTPGTWCWRTSPQWYPACALNHPDNPSSAALAGGNTTLSSSGAIPASRSRPGA